MSGIHDAAVDTFSSSSPPWWAQPRYAVGILGGIAAALVWFLMAVVTSSLSAIAAAQAQTTTALERHEANREAGDTAQLRLLSQICLNTSQTDRERAQCQAVTR